MNERPFDDGQAPMPDEGLAAHLRRRGDRPVPAGLTRSVLARIAETTPERRWRLAAAEWRPRLAFVAAGAAVVLVASLLLVAPPAARVGTSPTPSPSSSASTEVTWDPTQRALTPPELVKLMTNHPDAGSVFIVDDQIDTLLLSCASEAPRCANGTLVSAGLPVFAPSGGHLPADPTSTIRGPLALQVDEAANLVFLGSVISNGNRLEFTAKDLAQRNAMGGLFVIPGWIHGTGPVPCPSIVTTPAPLPTSELGLPAPRLDYCAGAAYLTDTDPGLPPYVGATDPDALAVVRDALGPPEPDGSARRGVYLVRDWAGYGEILSGLQLIGIPDTAAPSTTPSAAPTESTPPASPPTSSVMSLDELMRAARSGGLPPGSLIAVDVPASAVSDRWASGAVHSCPQLCPEWRITSGDQVLSVAVSMQQEPMPARPVGEQAFLIEPDGSLRALGPVAVGQDGGPLDPSATAKVTGLAVVHGWLRIGPAIPCPAIPWPTKRTGLLGEALTWSQCPGTWILPTDADPWAGPPNRVINSDGSGEIRTGDASVPAGTLHVQDGATDSGLEGEGLWLVRPSIKGCPPGEFCVAFSPPSGVTWWELVGPVLTVDTPGTAPTPAPTPSQPAQPVSPTVWTSAELQSAVINGPLAPGTVVIVDGTVQLYAGPPGQPARGEAIGVLESLRVFWNSDASLGYPTGSGRFAVRVRADRTLDYLGPAALDGTGAPFTGPTIPIGGTIGPTAQATLYVVHGWSFLAPPARCAAPLPLASAQHQVTGLDGRALSFRCPISYILPSAASPYHASSDGYSLEMPDGTLVVQSGALPTTTMLAPPAEGVFLVRYISCPWTPAFDSCDVLPTTPSAALWELVGQVDSPAPVSP